MMWIRGMVEIDKIQILIGDLMPEAVHKFRIVDFIEALTIALRDRLDLGWVDRTYEGLNLILRARDGQALVVYWDDVDNALFLLRSEYNFRRGRCFGSYERNAKALSRICELMRKFQIQAERNALHVYETKARLKQECAKFNEYNRDATGLDLMIDAIWRSKAKRVSPWRRFGPEGTILRRPMYPLDVSLGHGYQFAKAFETMGNDDLRFSARKKEIENYPKIVRITVDCTWAGRLKNPRQRDVNDFVRSLGFYWGSLIHNENLKDVLKEPGDCLLRDVFGEFELFTLSQLDEKKNIITRKVYLRNNKLVITDNATFLLTYIVARKLTPVNRPYCDKTIRLEMCIHRIAHVFPIPQTLIQLGLLGPMTLVMDPRRKLPVHTIQVFQLADEQKDRLITQLYDRRNFGFERIWRYIGFHSPPQHPTHLVIMMENIKLGSVTEYVRSQTQNLDRLELSRFCFETSEALHYLEKYDFVHKRLSVDCLLLTCDRHVKLVIYGLSQGELYPTTVDLEDPERAKWVPPECLRRGRTPEDPSPHEYDNTSVVHTFGTVIWSIFHHCFAPYEQETAAEVTSYAYRIENPLDVMDDYIPHSIDKVMNSCWSADPDRRPDFKEIKGQIRKAVRDMLPFQ
ncbi:unnamed protein product, partial [Mesorhabditis spiculigera]